MTESDRVVYLVFSFLFGEEVRLTDEVHNRLYMFKRNETDLQCVEAYRNSVAKYNYFKEFQARAFDMLRRL